jgi:hypothetical protein
LDSIILCLDGEIKENKQNEKLYEEDEHEDNNDYTDEYKKFKQEKIDLIQELVSNKKEVYQICLHKDKTLDDLKDYEVVRLAPYQNPKKPLQVEINATQKEIKKGIDNKIIAIAVLKKSLN